MKTIIAVFLVVLAVASCFAAEEVVAKKTDKRGVYGFGYGHHVGGPYYGGSYHGGFGYPYQGFGHYGHSPYYSGFHGGFGHHLYH